MYGKCTRYDIMRDKLATMGVRDYAAFIALYFSDKCSFCNYSCGTNPSLDYNVCMQGITSYLSEPYMQTIN